MKCLLFILLVLPCVFAINLTQYSSSASIRQALPGNVVTSSYFGGNVGLGINPMSGEQLDVAGAIGIHKDGATGTDAILLDGVAGSISANGFLNVAGGVVTADNKGLKVAGTNTLPDSNGNIGVYSTDSFAIDKGGQIDLGGNYTGASPVYFASVAGRKQSAIDGNKAGYLQFNVNTGSDGIMREYARLTDTGKLGIGTTAPSTKLEVAGTVSANEFATVPWTSWPTSSVVGITADAFSKIYYKKVGKTVHVNFYLSGTSSATNLEFTLPYALVNLPMNFHQALGLTNDAGTTTTTPGRVAIVTNTTTALIYKDSASGAWTNSSTRIASAYLIYETN